MPTPGDSVSGRIDYRNDIKNMNHCVFMDSSGRVTNFRPFSIFGYRFTDGKFYISKYIKKKDVVTPSFVEYLVRGKKNLYYQRDETGAHFLIDYRNDTVIEVVYKVDYLAKDGFEYVGESKLHQAYLKAYFKDCPALVKEIDRITVPDINNMVSLTRQYHHLTCGDSGCVVYYKKHSRFRVDVEFRMGMILYPELADEYEWQYAGLAHFWLPRSNERMYLVTGFIYGPLHNYGSTYSMHKVPVKFEYAFPFKVLSPRIEAGVNFMVLTENKRQAGLSIDFPVSAGVLFTPVRFMGINLSVESELFPFVGFGEFKFDHFLTAYSFNAGICVRF